MNFDVDELIRSLEEINAHDVPDGIALVAMNAAGKVRLMQNALSTATARAERAEKALRELVDAGDYCVTATDDVKAMLRFGKATEAARLALSNTEGEAP